MDLVESGDSFAHPQAGSMDDESFLLLIYDKWQVWDTSSAADKFVFKMLLNLFIYFYSWINFLRISWN